MKHRQAWCTVCRVVVDPDGPDIGRDHNGHMLDCSWHALVNPDNEPWLPGYRFHVTQPSKNAAQRNSGRMRTREYAVHYEIDRNGLLRWTGGVSPTDRTQAAVEDLYARERPGSNYGPGGGLEW